MTATFARSRISEQTFYRWKKRFAGLGIAQLRRLRTLEEENGRPKQHVLFKAEGYDLLGRQAANSIRAALQ